MWLFASVVAICATVIYLARTLGPPRLEVLIAPKVPPVGPEGTPESSIPQPPIEVMMFCAQESEPHAREVMLARAHKLYAQSRSWDDVMAVLQKEAE